MVSLTRLTEEGATVPSPGVASVASAAVKLAPSIAPSKVTSKAVSREPTSPDGLTATIRGPLRSIVNADETASAIGLPAVSVMSGPTSTV